MWASASGQVAEFGGAEAGVEEGGEERPVACPDRRVFWHGGEELLDLFGREGADDSLALLRLGHSPQDVCLRVLLGDEPGGERLEGCGVAEDRVARERLVFRSAEVVSLVLGAPLLEADDVRTHALGREIAEGGPTVGTRQEAEVSSEVVAVPRDGLL